MKIFNEDELLDPAIRKKIIEEINGGENKNRKNRSFKGYEVYKDKSNVFVVDKMLQLFDRSTVTEMGYSISNLSILRKIIDKLARVYSLGVERTARDEKGDENKELTEKVNKISKILGIDTQMKKLNRLLKLQKNMADYIKPTKVSKRLDGLDVYTLKVQPTAPFLYDAVENGNDCEKPLAYIFSHYKPQFMIANTVLTNQAIATHQVVTYEPFGGNNKDELIADTPEDSEDIPKDQYIWWTNKYHFTTDCEGDIVSNDGNLNPINEMPITNFALDQDGQFWAKGGDDLVDGSVLVNCMISHTMHIGVTQGYGQFYATGKNIPSSMKLGPNKGIKIEVESKEDPIPQVGFLSANPPLAELRGLIEMYVALILTTNNLSTSGVAVQLGNQQNPASGVALMIDKAESMEDVHDQAQIFKDKEPEMWRIIAKWMQLYAKTDQLVPELKELILPEDIRVEVKFPDPKPIFSEKEKLEAMKLRDELGISSKLDLIKIDNPDLTDEQAEDKLKEILEERMAHAAHAADLATQNGATNPNDPNANNQVGANGQEPVA